jgi:hypothetical protein
LKSIAVLKGFPGESHHDARALFRVVRYFWCAWPSFQSFLKRDRICHDLEIKLCLKQHQICSFIRVAPLATYFDPANKIEERHNLVQAATKKPCRLTAKPLRSTLKIPMH